MRDDCQRLQASEERNKGEQKSLHFFPPFSSLGKSPRIISSWVTCLSWNILLRTGCKAAFKPDSPTQTTWTGCGEGGYSVTEVWEVDAGLPKINTHYTFYSKIIRIIQSV